MTTETDPVFEAALAVLGDHCQPDSLAAWEAGDPPRALWRDLDETGLLSLLLPEDSGGIGAGADTFAAILRLAGRLAAPGPLAETCVGRWLSHAAGLPVPAGAMSVSLDGNEAPGGADTETLGVLSGDGLLLLPAAGSSQRRNLAGEARLRPAASNLRPVALPGQVAARARALVSLGRAAMMLGALDRVLALSLEHANTRVQFGRPIGKFQAVQQSMAVLAGGVAAAAAVVSAAAREVDAGGPGLLLAAARARLGEISVEAAGIAHQVHGAIGTTREYELHFHTRRLSAWRAEQGTPRAARRFLARRFAEAPAGALWETLLAAG